MRLAVKNHVATEQQMFGGDEIERKSAGAYR
jgi:hypothetical protein